jgi:hypothetical protein
VHTILVMFRLTFREAARKRVLLAALGLGAAFVALDAIGFHFIVKGFAGHMGPLAAAQKRFTIVFFSLAGLYAVNFLTAMAAVMLPVDTLAGEIVSGVAQTLAARPVRRSGILLGKWLAYVAIVAGYQLLLAGGVLAVAAAIGGYVPPHLALGLPLMVLESALLVTLSVAGGARFTTVTNGMIAFGLYGLAFVGGWVEQVGAWTHNTAARDVGTIASLVMPTESLWQRAAHEMQPAVMAQLQLTPFSPASVPSAAMIVWAGAWALAVLAWGLRGFSRRPL